MRRGPVWSLAVLRKVSSPYDDGLRGRDRQRRRICEKDDYRCTERGSGRGPETSLQWKSHLDSSDEISFNVGQGRDGGLFWKWDEMKNFFIIKNRGNVRKVK